MTDLNKRVDQFVEEKELEISKQGLTVDGPEAGRLWRGIVDELYDKEEDREFSKAVRQEIRDRGYLDN